MHSNVAVVLNIDQLESMPASGQSGMGVTPPPKGVQSRVLTATLSEVFEEDLLLPHSISDKETTTTSMFVVDKGRTSTSPLRLSQRTAPFLVLLLNIEVGDISKQTDKVKEFIGGGVV